MRRLRRLLTARHQRRRCHFERYGRSGRTGGRASGADGCREWRSGRRAGWRCGSRCSWRGGWRWRRGGGVRGRRHGRGGGGGGTRRRELTPAAHERESAQQPLAVLRRPADQEVRPSHAPPQRTSHPARAHACRACTCPTSQGPHQSHCTHSSTPQHAPARLHTRRPPARPTHTHPTWTRSRRK